MGSGCSCLRRKRDSAFQDTVPMESVDTLMLEFRKSSQQKLPIPSGSPDTLSDVSIPVSKPAPQYAAEAAPVADAIVEKLSSNFEGFDSVTPLARARTSSKYGFDATELTQETEDSTGLPTVRDVAQPPPLLEHGHTSAQHLQAPAYEPAQPEPQHPDHVSTPARVATPVALEPTPPPAAALAPPRVPSTPTLAGTPAPTPSPAVPVSPASSAPVTPARLAPAVAPRATSPLAPVTSIFAPAVSPLALSKQASAEVRGSPAPADSDQSSEQKPDSNEQPQSVVMRIKKAEQRREQRDSILSPSARTSVADGPSQRTSILPNESEDEYAARLANMKRARQLTESVLLRQSVVMVPPLPLASPVPDTDTEVVQRRKQRASSNDLAKKRLSQNIALEFMARQPSNQTKPGPTGHGLGAAADVVSIDDAETLTEQAWVAIDCAPRFNKSIAPDASRKTWKTVRIFVSSTFTDMFEEREVLVKQVFPKLRTWCESKRIRLMETDLRWGVPKESTAETVFRTCLEELDRCYAENELPFFLSLLSHRYGWVPSIQDVPTSVRSEFHWIPNLSITHMEIFHGALRCDNPNACFFLRNGEFLGNLPKDFQSSFVDTNALHSHAITELKEQLRQRYPEQIFDYYPSFNGVDNSTGLPKVRLGGMEQFSAHAYEYFRKAIEQQYPLASTEDLSDQEVFSLQHEDVVHAHASGFVGRDAELRQITEFLASADTSTQSSPILLVTGPTGHGKTAFLVKAAELARNKGARVFTHFVLDAGANASDLTHLLLRIILEFGDESMKTAAREPDAKSRALFSIFESMIGSESSVLNAQSPLIVLVVDGVQAISDPDSTAQAYWWLPAAIHPRVRVIFSSSENLVTTISTRSDDPQHASSGSLIAIELSLEAIPKTDASEIVSRTLLTFNKRLDDTQMKTLLGNGGAGLPLWLKVACEELRVFGVFETVSKRISELADSIDGLLLQLLARIEDSADSNKYQETLCLLASSQFGLSETDLRILLRDEDQETLPLGDWATILSQLKPLLRKLGADKFCLLNYSVREMVLKFYVERGESLSPPLTEEGITHRCWQQLADYLSTVDDEQRKTDEYPFYLVELNDKERLVELMKGSLFARLPYRLKRRVITVVRCRNVIFSQSKPRPEFMCMTCSMQMLPSRLMRRNACVVCMSLLFTQSFQPGTQVKLTAGESQAVRCQKHNFKAYMPSMGPSMSECLACKQQWSSSIMYPAVVCQTCSWQQACCSTS
eukprot:m.492081 g.492081  ORF g.492081 m.492081 type:complete len:1245 (+) comp57275_c0_seq1:82-3816(+)